MGLEEVSVCLCLGTGAESDGEMQDLLVALLHDPDDFLGHDARASWRGACKRVLCRNHSLTEKGHIMSINETAAHLSEELAGAVKQVADLGRTAGAKLDEVRQGAADALAGAASSVRNTGRQGSGTIEDLSKGTAYKLDSTAAYVRNHDLGDMLGNVRRLVREHPASSVVGAVAVGFLLGSAIRRK